MTHPRYSRHPQADRLLVVLSDIEMGAGGITDDFPETGFLVELILSFNAPPFDDLDVVLVLNGDTFDLLKTPYMGGYPCHISAQVGLGKLAKVVDAHPRFFACIGQFLGHEGAAREVHFVAGNHDAELLFPEVQAAVRSHCGGSDSIHFPGLALDVGQVHLEHGSQGDPMFRMEADRLFVQGTPQILNLSWGSVGLLDVVIPIHHRLHHLDRVRPRELLFDVLPEVKELLVTRSWHYWTRDYLRDLIQGADPVKRITWQMVSEIVYRFASADTEASISNYYQDQLMDSAQRLFVVGHCHQAGWWSRGDNKLLQTGCFRNEYTLRAQGREQVPLAKVYAEVYMRGPDVLRSQLIELEGPPLEAPPSVFSFRPAVLELLGSDEARDRAAAERAAHEKKSSKP